MRRRTRKLVIDLALFGTALFLILYVNRPRSRIIYAWTKIRYKTTSNALPAANGICPGLSKSSKPALVVSRVAADGSPKWLTVSSLKNKYHLCVYTADASADAGSDHLQVPANRGHEAMAYLTFIIDNYAHLPTAGAVFGHGSRYAWHNDHVDYDNTVLLSTLNVSAALAPWGYHNLRCDWGAGTCTPSEAPPQGSLETSMRALLEPWNSRALSDAALPDALAALFGDESGPSRLERGAAVRAQCCAQFVVAKENIWRWEKEEYIALRQWLLDGSDGSDPSNRRNINAAPSDDRVAGRILSDVWHILFLQLRLPANQASAGVDLERLNDLACPHAESCYCRLYGLCDLEGCKRGSCHGQYYLPQNFELPGDWALTHP
ncbi:MAG: hypothetical protein Q9195_005609 [Heterodermia aff. obscurata]